MLKTATGLAAKMDPNDARKLLPSKKKLKDMDLTSIGINNLVYINDSLGTYHKFLWN